MKKGSNVTAHIFFFCLLLNNKLLISLWSFIYILYSILSLESMMLFLIFFFWIFIFLPTKQNNKRNITVLRLVSKTNFFFVNFFVNFFFSWTTHYGNDIFKKQRIGLTIAIKCRSIHGKVNSNSPYETWVINWSEFFLILKTQPLRPRKFI